MLQTTSRIVARPVNSSGQMGNTVAVAADMKAANTNANGIPAAMPVVTNFNNVAALSSGVAPIGTMSPMVQGLEMSIPVLLDNSGSGTATDFLLFDGAGLYAARFPGTTTKGYLNFTSTYDAAILKAMTGNQPMGFKGFSIEVQNFASSLNRPINAYQIDFVGTIMNNITIRPNIGKRNTQYLANYQTFDFMSPTIAVANFAMVVTVAPGEITSLELYPSIAYGRALGTGQ